MLRTAIPLDGFHVAGVRGRAVEHLGRHGRASHQLAQRGVLQVCESGAPFAFGEEQIPQAGGSGDRFELFNYRGWLPAVACANLFVVRLLVGIDVLVHEGSNPFLQRLDLPGVFEIHVLPIVARLLLPNLRDERVAEKIIKYRPGGRAAVSYRAWPRRRPAAPARKRGSGPGCRSDAEAVT